MVKTIYISVAWHVRKHTTDNGVIIARPYLQLLRAHQKDPSLDMKIFNLANAHHSNGWEILV